MSSSRYSHCAPGHARWRGVGVGMAAGAVVAAAMIAVAAAPAARAGTPDDVLGQAGQDVTQALQVWDQIPQTSLDSDVLAMLTAQESLFDIQAAIVSQIESIQAGLPTVDQAGLADVDQLLLQADEQLLNATQALVSDGGLTDPGMGTILAGLELSAADFAAFGADVNVLGVTLGADLFSILGIPDFFLL